MKQAIVVTKGKDGEEDAAETIDVPIPGSFTLSVDDRVITSTMLLAIQEQQGQIDSLSARITALEGGKPRFTMIDENNASIPTETAV